MKSNLGNPTCPPPWIVPSNQLQIIVEQIFDGMRQLRLDGKYHGNFSLENTYYHMESGKPIVKLTNFRVKEGAEPLQCQLEDVWDIAGALDEICNIAEECSSAGRVPLDCCLVTDLSKKLKEVSLRDLATVMKDIKKHSFFWGPYERKRFFVSDLPFALRRSDFRDDVEASSALCTIPWDADPYSGLLQDMNAHRALHNKHAYDGSKKTSFCSFCSGLYSHEFELPVVQSRHLCVDKVLQQRNRKACFEMVGMMPDREKTYVIQKRGLMSWIQALGPLLGGGPVICQCSWIQALGPLLGGAFDHYARVSAQQKLNTLVALTKYSVKMQSGYHMTNCHDVFEEICS